MSTIHFITTECDKKIYSTPSEELMPSVLPFWRKSKTTDVREEWNRAYICKQHKVTSTMFCNVSFSFCNKKLNSSLYNSQFFPFLNFSVYLICLFKQQISHNICEIWKIQWLKRSAKQSQKKKIHFHFLVDNEQY